MTIQIENPYEIKQCSVCFYCWKHDESCPKCGNAPLNNDDDFDLKTFEAPHDGVIVLVP